MTNQQRFLDVLVQYGLCLSGMPIAGGAIHRVPVAGRKAQNLDGWYVLHGDHGSYGDWRTGETHHWGKDNSSDSDNFEALRKERLKERRLRESQRKSEYEKVAKKAQRLWDSARDKGYSDYWKRKQVPPVRLRFMRDTAIIPVRNISAQMQTLQMIQSNGEKRFLKGGQKSGGFHVIGKLRKNSRSFVCEGIATGLSIYLASRHPVIIAFDAGNLESVVRAFRQKYSSVTLTIAADNDCWGDRNIGHEKALAVSREFGLSDPLVPQFDPSIHHEEPTDFNDLHVLQGLEAVQQQLQGKAS